VALRNWAAPSPCSMRRCISSGFSTVCLLAALPGTARGLGLTPPTIERRLPGVLVLRVQVSQDLSLLVHEADAREQNIQVERALDAPSAGQAGASAAEDPYGICLWPAAQVVAQATAEMELQGARVLEIGAGTGLCSLTAAACGAVVSATDYRDEPLALLSAAARQNEAELDRQPLQLTTHLFDLLSDEPLPKVEGLWPTLLVAADILYFKSTATALAQRCVEALRGGCGAVLIGDCDRPGRGAFLAGLRERGVRAEAARFTDVDGWTAGTERNDLIAPQDADGPRSVRVGFMRLSPGDLILEA